MTNKKMTEQRFKDIVSSYGGDSSRWPENEAPAMLSFVADNQTAQNHLNQALSLDSLLNSYPKPKPASAEFLDKLSLMPPPKQQRRAAWGFDSFNKFIPTLNLSGFMPRAVGLASVCALGIVLGLSNVARYNGEITSVDAGSLIFGTTSMNQDIREID